MLPGKIFGPDEIFTILRKRVLWIMVPFALVAAATAVLVRFLPDRYKSEALIQVVPQRVPEEYVKSAVTTRIDDRLRATIQQILSRNRLEKLITDFNLYPDERRNGIMEDVVEAMRRDDVKVEIVKGDALKVSYVGRDPRVVQRIAERLASAFIEDSLRDRGQLADSTSNFLEGSLAEKRVKLVEVEKQMEDYTRKHAGSMPNELQSNLQLLQNNATNTQSVVEALNAAKNSKNLIEAALTSLNDEIAEAQQQKANATPGVTPSDPNELPPGATATQRLEAARASLQLLQQHFTPEHPNVVRMDRMVRELEPQAALEAKTLRSPAEVNRNNKLEIAKIQLDQVNRQIKQRTDDEQKLRAQATLLEARLASTPERDSEMTALTRDYTTLRHEYDTLLAKEGDSKLAAKMEHQEIGEQLRLVDQARVPEKPFSPNRLLINAGGLITGLFVGLALVFLLEYRDNTFKTDTDIYAVLAIPVLAVVPLMESAEEQKRHTRRRFAVAASLATVVMMCFGVVIYTLVR